MVRVVALVVILVASLAGCTAPDDAAGPDDLPPADHGTSADGPTGSDAPTSEAPANGAGVHWADWGGFYAGRLLGYGYIGTDEQGYGPPLDAVAVDQDGRVLTFQIAYSLHSGPASMELDDASKPWRVALAEIVAPGTVYPEHGPNRFRVTDAAVRELPQGEWASGRAAIEDGLARAREPQQNQGVMVADGGSRFIGAGGQRVTLDYNHDEGGGWGDVEDELVELLEGSG